MVPEVSPLRDRGIPARAKYFLKKYTTRIEVNLVVFLGVKDSRPIHSLVWAGERLGGIGPHILAVLLGATCTSHETHNSCRSPQAPQLTASLSVTEPFHRPFSSRFYGRKIPIEI